MNGWYREIRALIAQHPNDDSMTLARKLIEGFDEEQLVMLIADEIEHQQRVIARDQEQATFAPMLARSGLTVAELFATQDRTSWKALMVTPFALGGRQRVAWGEATVEQHQTRIALLAKLREGLDVTIRFHSDAIATIEAAGVTCLNDLEAAA